MRSITVKLLAVAAIPLIAVSYTNCSQYALQNYELSAEGLKQSLTIGGIVINDDAPFTNSKQVTLRLVHESADEMYVTDDQSCESGGQWEDYAPIKSWTLRNSDSRVFVRFRPKKTPDFVSPCFSDEIGEDYGEPTIQIQRNPAEYLNENPLNLAIVAQDDLSGIQKIECVSDAGFPTACTPDLSQHSGLNDGPHSVRAVAIDKAGNRSKEAVATFFVDRTAPRVKINQAPAEIVASGDATFHFTGDEASDVSSGVAEFRCQVDNGAWFSCVSPYTTSVDEKTHTFRVKSIDRAGNASAVAEHSWKVDSSAPSVTITSSPSQYSKFNKATFNFEGTDSGVPLTKFECQRDGGAYAGCSPGITYTGLSDGPHSFKVVAIDDAGNRSAPAVAEWVVDTSAPTVALTGKPDARSMSQTPVFTFTVSDGTGSGIENTFCSIDGANFVNCNGSFVSPTALAEGQHVFYVLTRDKAGNDSARIDYRWYVDLTRPAVQFDSTPAQLSTNSVAAFAFHGTDPNGGAISGYLCKVDLEAYASCSSPFEIRDLGQGGHSLLVKSVDSVGWESDAVQFNFAVDSQAPSISLAETPETSVAPNAEAIIDFNVTDQSEIRSVSCGFVGELAPCSHQARVNVAKSSVGTYVYRIEAEDVLGQVSSIEYSWKVELSTRPVAQDISVATNNKVDVVVIIDDSGSMDTERASLGNKFGDFLGKLNGLDWRVGVITTNVAPICQTYRSCGCGGCYNYQVCNGNEAGRLKDIRNGASGQYYLSPATTDASSKFKATVEGNLGTVSGYEQGIASTNYLIARTGLSQSATENSRAKNFFRDDAALSVIVVTDADETPEGSTQDWNKPDALINAVKAKWPSKSFSFHSIVVKDGDSGCLAKDGNEAYGKSYISLSKKTGGVVGSVCEADYANQLGSIATATVEQIRSVTLTCAPVDVSGQGNPVRVVNSNGSPAPSYTINGLKLTFSANLPAGTNRLEYDCLQ